MNKPTTEARAKFAMLIEVIQNLRPCRTLEDVWEQLSVLVVENEVPGIDAIEQLALDFLRDQRRAAERRR
jgi:hypothetical protein